MFWAGAAAGACLRAGVHSGEAPGVTKRVKWGLNAALVPRVPVVQVLLRREDNIRIIYLLLALHVKHITPIAYCGRCEPRWVRHVTNRTRHIGKRRKSAKAECSASVGR